MLREKCRTCGGSDLYQGRMAQGQSGVMSAKSFFRFAPVAKCTVCVTCGGVEPYMDEKGIAIVKKWKATEGHQFPVTPSEGEDTRMQVNLRVVLTILGALAAIAAFMIQLGSVSDKFK